MANEFQNASNEGGAIERAVNDAFHTHDRDVRQNTDAQLAQEFLRLGKEPHALANVLEQMRDAKRADPSAPTFYVVHDTKTDAPLGILLTPAKFDRQGASYNFTEAAADKTKMSYVAEGFRQLGGIFQKDPAPETQWDGVVLHRNVP